MKGFIWVGISHMGNAKQPQRECDNDNAWTEQRVGSNLFSRKAINS